MTLPNINIDVLFPSGISKEELKKIQEKNKLTEINLTCFAHQGNIRMHECNINGSLDLNIPMHEFDTSGGFDGD